jgi:hypothetical protein
VPAQKINYIVVYPHDAQVYGCSSKDIALQSPPPEGFSLSDKKIFFVSMEPENGNLAWYQIPRDEIENAEIVYPKSAQKKKKE